jgi:dephospho-CoA kinase
MTKNLAKRPLIIGITGNIGTGKSTVLRYLADKGAHVVDADQLTHRALASDGPAYGAVVAAFGATILNTDGSINRPALGKVVFADPEKLAQLESIVHPAVFQLAQQEIAGTGAPVVILEAIKLLETGCLVKLCDEIWVVTASLQTQIKRLMEQRNMSEAEARRRMAAQSAQEDKVRQATRLIDNDGPLQSLYAQLDAIWRMIDDERYTAHGHKLSFFERVQDST